MLLGFMWITFRKADGCICTEKATRRLDLIPDTDKHKSSGSASGTPAVLAFYSETDHAWRSFKADNLITFKAA